jgi:hypothetical protein
MSNDINKDDKCGLCGFASNAGTWKVTTPKDFGWECDNDCAEHIECANCGQPL